MGFKALWAAAAVGFIGAAGFAYFERSRAIEAEQEIATLRSALAEEKRSESELRARLGQESDALKNQEAQLERELRELEAKAERARQNGKQLLAQLQNLASGRSGDTPDLEARLKAAQDIVQNLESKQKLLSQSDGAVARDRKASLDAAQSGARIGRERIDQQIFAQNQAIKETQSQLAYWKGQKNDPNRSMNVQSLNHDLQVEQAQLSSYKQEKISIDQIERESKLQVASAADGQKENIAAEKADVDSKLKAAKLDLDDAKKRLAETKRGDGDLAAKRKRLETEARAEAVKVENLEAEISAKKAQIEAIKSKEKSQ